MDAHQTSAWIGHEFAGGRYRIKDKLGEGGMATVYQAWDQNLGTDVVVKVPHATLLQDAEFAERFAREISSLVKLSHLHIVKITDVGEHGGVPFAVMQFLPGGNLEDRQKCGPNGEVKVRPTDSLKTWLPNIAKALDFVHSQGYIHRDVKPANILFDAHGHAYLSDFGIATSVATGQTATSMKSLTESNLIHGTPEYMAPELILGQSCDGRVDQYALAITVFEVLAGRRPFEGANIASVLEQQTKIEPPDLLSLNPGVPTCLQDVIRRGLSKDATERFSNCQLFADAVLAEIDSLPSYRSADERTAHALNAESFKGRHGTLLELIRSAETASETVETDKSEVGVDETAGDERLSQFLQLLGTAEINQGAVRTQSIKIRNSSTRPRVRDILVATILNFASRHELVPKWRKLTSRLFAAIKHFSSQHKRLTGASINGAAALLVLSVALTVLTAHGSVRISIKGIEESVTITLDGEDFVIIGPEETVRLSTGEHRLTIKSPRFKTITKVFNVSRGENKPVEIDLPKKPSAPPQFQGRETTATPPPVQKTTATPPPAPQPVAKPRDGNWKSRTDDVFRIESKGIDALQIEIVSSLSMKSGKGELNRNGNIAGWSGQFRGIFRNDRSRRNRDTTIEVRVLDAQEIEMTTDFIRWNSEGDETDRKRVPIRLRYIEE